MLTSFSFWYQNVTVREEGMPDLSSRTIFHGGESNLDIGAPGPAPGSAHIHHLLRRHEAEQLRSCRVASPSSRKYKTNLQVNKNLYFVVFVQWDEVEKNYHKCSNVKMFKAS